MHASQSLDMMAVQAEVWRLLGEATSGDRGPIAVDSDEDMNALIEKLVHPSSQSKLVCDVLMHMTLTLRRIETHQIFCCC